MPDFSTIYRRQKTHAVNIPYGGAKDPQHLLLDSTGIKVQGKESGAPASMAAQTVRWHKNHIDIDEQTLEIRAVKFTGSNTGAAPMLPHLLS